MQLEAINNILKYLVKQKGGSGTTKADLATASKVIINKGLDAVEYLETEGLIHAPLQMSSIKLYRLTRQGQAYIESNSLE
jgi:predicted transcriptional regulator